MKSMAGEYLFWSHWQRGCGFDIANTKCLSRDEKIMLLKGMRERAQSLGKREWTDEEIKMLRRIKDYTHHIGDWSDGMR